MQEHGAAVEDSYSGSLDCGAVVVGRGVVVEGLCALHSCRNLRQRKKNGNGGAVQQTYDEGRSWDGSAVSQLLVAKMMDVRSGGLKRLLAGEGGCYMHRDSGMTVMMVVWLRERERISYSGATVNATEDRLWAFGGRCFLEGDKP
ncbi:multidrug transporter [Sesbania bispinosa]|nr:multidrug transporter [Sesbania bispinosa]